MVTLLLRIRTRTLNLSTVFSDEPMAASHASKVRIGESAKHCRRFPCTSNPSQLGQSRQHDELCDTVNRGRKRPVAMQRLGRADRLPSDSRARCVATREATWIRVYPGAKAPHVRSCQKQWQNTDNNRTLSPVRGCQTKGHFGWCLEPGVAWMYARHTLLDTS